MLYGILIHTIFWYVAPSHSGRNWLLFSFNFILTVHASRVVQCIYQSTREYGFPSCVRLDSGGQNYLVSVLMCMVHRANQESLIAGRSVHDQRIETLWRDIFRFCISTFYFLFHFMEELGVLHQSDKLHLFALHYVFIPRVNNIIIYHRTPQNLWETVNPLAHSELFSMDTYIICLRWLQEVQNQQQKFFHVKQHTSIINMIYSI